MNKYKKSLTQLIVHIPVETLIVWAQDFEYYIDNMQELVDRATPYKPIKMSNLYGRCKCGYSNPIKTDFCTYCGQALDWDE